MGNERRRSAATTQKKRILRTCNLFKWIFGHPQKRITIFMALNSSILNRLQVRAHFDSSIRWKEVYFLFVLKEKKLPIS